MYPETEVSAEIEQQYMEAWVKGERAAALAGFQAGNPWGWGIASEMEVPEDSTPVVPEGSLSDKSDVPVDFTKGDFVKALKKVGRPLGKGKS